MPTAPAKGDSRSCRLSDLRRRIVRSIPVENYRRYALVNVHNPKPIGWRVGDDAMERVESCTSDP